MKALLSASICGLSLLAAAPALAEEPPPLPPLPPPAEATPAPASEAAPSARPAAPGPARPPPPVMTVGPESTEAGAAEPGKGAGGVPAARTGFQMAIRTGVAIPFGKVEGGGGTNAMRDYVSPQVPVSIDIGGKPSPKLLLGAYLGIAAGGAAGAFADACDRLNAACVSATFRLGIQAQVHFLPDRKANPWVGYGLGVESTGVAGETPNGSRISTTFAGWEIAHLSAGVDFRLSRTLGFGPAVGFSAGRYVSATIESGGSRRDGDLRTTAFHEWLTLGGRMTIFP